MSNLVFTVRPMAAADRRFVRETTLKVRMPRGGNWTAWEAAHGLELDRALDDSDNLTVVADAGDDLLLGFATALAISGADAAALSMIYVKRELRGNGVGIALLAVGWGRFLDVGPLRVVRPTPSFRRWAALHRIPFDAGEGDAPTD